MAAVSTNDYDNDDTTPSRPGGATGSPGVPCNAPDVSPPAGTQGSAPPTALIPPAGTSTANQPRPEDFMGRGESY